MGSDLIDRFQRAGLEAKGQRRNVTILFADLSDYTGLAERMDSEDLYILIQQFIRTLAAAVYKYEGMVDKIIGDGLMALFGAPIAHENNAERAVHAALDMQAEVEGLSGKLVSQLGHELKVHIGLHSGTVIVGGVGSNLLMDYTAIGDTVNLSHRLEEAAPAGHILVSESVYRQTRVLFDYKVFPSLKLKGISRPVVAYRLIKRKSRPGSVRGLEGLKAPLVGREDELGSVKQAIQDLVSQKQGRFILLTGEAGIGKSRLTAEVKSQMSHLPVNIFEGQSLTYRRSVSYWIFQDLIRNYLQITPDTPTSIAHERLVAKAYEVLGSQAANTLPYLEHLLSLQHVDEKAALRLAYLEASQLRQMIFLAVRDLLVAEARRKPVILILEDLHWADDASLDLLGYLVDSIYHLPVLIYGISRPFQKGRLNEIADQAKSKLGEFFTRIPLKALSLEQSEDLFIQLLSIPKIPAELSDQVLQRAAGIPFYLEEILRMLIDADIIKREENHWRLSPGADISAIGVPDTLRDLILARFDRMEPHHRRVLQAASVIGRHFNLQLLSSVVRPNDERQLQDILDYLVERDFIRSLNGHLGSDYMFRHVLTSDAVYSTLLRIDRSNFHGLVAEAVERLHADQIESQVEVLAGHFLRSAKLDRALHYLILAGQKAARDYANGQARLHYQEALSLLHQVEHSLDQLLDIHGGLGDVLLFVGDYVLAREQYQAAIKALADADTEQHILKRSVLMRKMAATFERQGDYDEANMYLSQAGELLLEEYDIRPEEQAQISNDIGWIHFLRGNLDEAQDHLNKALTLVLESSQYDVIASIHNRLGAVAYHQRTYEKAAAHVRKSLVLRETIGDMAGVARLYNNLGLLGLMRGDLRDAEANLIQGIEILERIGDAEGIALAYTNLGLVQFDQGRFEMAEANLERSLRAANQIGHRFYGARALMYLGRLKTALGQFLQAQQLLDESISVLEELGAQEDVIDALYYQGENSFGLGDLDSALELLRRSDAIMHMEAEEKLPLSAQRGRLLRLQGAVARLKGEWKKSKELLLESAAIFNSSDERLESAKTALELGYLIQAQNNRLEARQYFQEARLIFKQLGAEHNLRKTEEVLSQLT